MSCRWAVGSGQGTVHCPLTTPSPDHSIASNRISSTLIVTRASSDAETVSTTGAPTFRRARRSTPSPRAAIARSVSQLESVFSWLATFAGMTPAERSSASNGGSARMVGNGVSLGGFVLG